MRYWTLSLRGAAVTALFTCLNLTSLAALALDVSSTQAEEAAVAVQKTSTVSVIRGTFTTAVEDGEPIDFRSEIQNSVPEVFFFTELEGAAGQSITHRWKYRNQVMEMVKLDMKNDPGKVWSSRKMRPEWTGAWEVEVVDGNGQIIYRGTLAFEAPL